MKSDKRKQNDDEMLPEEVFFGGFALYAFLVFLFVIVLALAAYWWTN
jgi:hypothetical protein